MSTPAAPPTPPSPSSQSANPAQSDAVAAALAKARAAAPPAAPKPAPHQAAPAPKPAQAAPTKATDASAPPVTKEGPVWRKFFYDWPVDIPPRGIMVNQLNEAVPFKAFLLREDVVMLQRPAPDAMGARFLFVPYEEIAIIKLTDPLKQENFTTGGFEGELA